MHDRLLAERLFDGSRVPRPEGETVLFPLTDEAARHVASDPRWRDVGTVVDAALPARRPRAPQAAVQATLAAEGWSAADLAMVPAEWDLVGDVALVKGTRGLTEETAFARALARALGAGAVLEDLGVEGPLRVPRVRHLWGRRDTRTVHVERGVRFVLDPARVMFSSGNVHERGRLLGLVGPDEVVVDLFAGVGYFTLPLALLVGCRVHACELNPVAAAFLRGGCGANGVEGLVTVHEGDARDVAPQGVAHRVIMGYVHGTLHLLPTAVGALAGQGILHVHETVEARAGPAALAADVVARLDALGAQGRVTDARVVKGYAPGVVHAAVDVEVSA